MGRLDESRPEEVGGGCGRSEEARGDRRRACRRRRPDEGMQEAGAGRAGQTRKLTGRFRPPQGAES